MSKTLKNRYELYKYATDFYESLIVDTKTNKFVKYGKLLELITSKQELISEIVNDLNEHEDTIDLRKKWNEKFLEGETKK